MKSKRAATSDLNHENWDKEEEPEEAGTFKQASEEELKKRVIKTARRRKPDSNSSKDERANIFSTFAGFKKPDENNSPFSFLEKSITEAKINSDINQKISSTEEKTNGCNEDKKSDLVECNIQFLNWLNSLIKKNSKLNLSPFLLQYEKAYNELFLLENHSSTDNECSDNLVEEKFVFIKSKNLQSSNISSSNEKINSKDPKERPNVFANIKFPLFSFDNALNNSVSNSVSSPPIFNFSDFKKSDFGKVETTIAEIADDTEPPKPEFKAVVEEDSKFSIKCKIFYLINENYSDRGVGMLYLKPIKDSEKTQLIVRADTNLGNILLNFILNKNYPFEKVGKNNLVTVCIPTPECEQKPISILIRVKNEHEVNDLFENIKKCIN